MVRIAVACAAMLGSAWAGACLDEHSLVEPPILPVTPPTLAPIVSNPVAAASATSAAAFSVVGGSSGTDVAYVSLPPGTIPDGGLATVRNTRTGASAAAAMAAGGFDPVAIEASAGDTLALEVQRAEGGSPVTFSLVVLVARRPVVVRTDPPPRKRDVPLNAPIVVVFSEPINPATAGNIRLLSAGVPVGGSVAVTAGGLRAEFTPSSLLLPNADYVLSISTGVQDLSGDPLEQAVAAQFTTGSAVVVASVATDPVALFINSVTGQLRTFAMSAILYDDGRVTGSFSTFYAGTGGLAFGPVTCFTVVDGKAAWIASVTEGSSNPALVGREYGWRAVDNGQPGDGVPDQLSLSHFLEPGTLTGQDFCAATPLTDPNEGVIEEIVLNNLLSGDIVVNPSGPPPPLPPGGMSRIVFVDVGGIHVMNADGSNNRRLTTNPGDYQPTWSPDARMIAFSRQRYDLGRSDLDIFVMNADGSGVRQLTSGASHDGAPAWSPDGSRIAFKRGEWTPACSCEPEFVFVMNAIDGSGATKLAGPGAGSPTWSPDGSRIAFSMWDAATSDYHIYIMNADASGVVQLTRGPANDLFPAWSPEGGRIAFFSDRDSSGAIYVMSAADGSGVTQLTGESDHLNATWSPPAWSPDGSAIAFNGFSGIAVMNVDGSATRRVASGNSPAWTRVGTVPPALVLSLQKVAGDRQTDTVLATLGMPLQVRVLSNNVPVAGVAVSWGWGNALPGSVGSITSVRSDAAGIASATVTLDPVAREVVVEAYVGGAYGSVVAFTATARPGTPVRLDALRGADQFSVVNVSYEYSVIARDGHGYPPPIGGGGNVIPGVPITWAVTAGGGSITPTLDTTAIDPRSGYSAPFSSALHTTGPADGTAEVTATAGTVPGAPQATFTTTVVSWIARVVDGGFVPEGVSVPSGGSVLWVWGWEDYPNDFSHNITFEDDPTLPTSSPTMYSGMFTRTFGGGPRTIRYRCTLHSTTFTEGEVGTVMVR